MKSPVVMERKTSWPLPWWAVLAVGIAAAAFGIVMLVSPKTTSPMLFQVLGGLCLAGGMVSLASILPWGRAHRGTRLLVGGIALLAGVALVAQPILSAYFASGLLVWIIGAAFLGLGWVLIIMAFSYAGWLYGVGGALSLIAGFAFVLGTALGPQMAPWLLGILATAGGIMAAIGAFQIRKTGQPAATP